MVRLQWLSFFWGRTPHTVFIVAGPSQSKDPVACNGFQHPGYNILLERLWRTVKYEEVYLKAYANATEARRELN